RRWILLHTCRIHYPIDMNLFCCTMLLALPSAHKELSSICTLCALHLSSHSLEVVQHKPLPLTLHLGMLTSRPFGRLSICFVLLWTTLLSRFPFLQPVRKSPHSLSHTAAYS